MSATPATQPPGTQPPGTQPPGTQPPGTQPPDPLGSLPPAARQSLATLVARLPPHFVLRNPRHTAKGWAVSIYTPDGEYGGEIGILDDAPASAHHRRSGSEPS